jgi:hypothetical protein
MVITVPVPLVSDPILGRSGVDLALEFGGS